MPVCPAGFCRRRRTISSSASLDDICIRHPESTYLVRAEGQSMQDAGILDGDLLVVECFYRAQHGDIVIANGEFTCWLPK